MYRPGPITIHHHYSFSQKVAVGRASLCGYCGPLVSLKPRRSEGLMHIKSIETESDPVGYKVRRGGARSGVFLVT
ncbi:hypothetical protein TNCV_4481511 [Trichonephila clavipes]|nr:hypothetical protein TNCV_4481511 [Trichonephila clavipes]